MRVQTKLLMFSASACVLALAGCATYEAVSPASSERALLFSASGKPDWPDESKTPLISSEFTNFQSQQLLPGLASDVSFRLGSKLVSMRVEAIDQDSISLNDDQFLWQGVSEDGVHAFFFYNNDRIDGQITDGTTVYRVRQLEDGTHIVEIINQLNFVDHPPLEPTMPVIPPQDSEVLLDSSCIDPPDWIDVLVVYTDQARDALGSNSAIEFEITMAVAQANLAYVNSGVAHRLNLVYSGPANFSESTGGVSSAVLGQLQNQTDGILDNVTQLRETHKADLVAMVVENASFCGVGNYQPNPDPDTTDHQAFSLVKRSCAVGYMSLAHEFGHNIGAHHDRYVVSGASATNYNYGHIQPAPIQNNVSPWRTVMAYNDGCDDAGVNCTRLPYFSTPLVSLQSDPTGRPVIGTNPEYNVLQYADVDQDVAKYRCAASAALPDVWMKDTWQDTGLEPDPATASQNMWRSPYIWIRNNQDTQLTQAHAHQNPEAGQLNYAYVKLENMGPQPATGDVELYVANASTSLNNPANWTPVGSQTMASFAPGTEIVEFPWSIASGQTGHYCLLARWNTTGLPLSFSSINAAVRSSNDLVWRNLNIVDLLPGDQLPINFTFEFGAPVAARQTWLAVIWEPKSGANLPWRRMVDASLHIDLSSSSSEKLKVTGGEYNGRGDIVFQLNKTPVLVGPFINGDNQIGRATIEMEPNRALLNKFARSKPEFLEGILTVYELTDEGAARLMADRSADNQEKSFADVIGGISYQVVAGQDR